MKRVLVTGSTQGIGKAIAARFVKNGFYVIVHCSSDLEKAKRVRHEIGAHAAVACDLSAPNAAENLKAATGEIDALVLNASVQYKQKWFEASPELIQKQLQVNFVSTVRLMQEYVPDMQKKGWGRVITIGSVNQHHRHPELSIYAATKCAVMSFVENVAKEVAPFGVTVNNVAPGAIDTPRNAAVTGNAELLAKAESVIPVGRFGTADECAGIVAYLAGEDASYITGADIAVDGGMGL